MEDGQNTNQRPYRSRKQRPCDACRKRKVLCDRPDGIPCRRCTRLSQPCTFVQRPTKRLRSNPEPSIDNLALASGVDEQGQWLTNIDNISPSADMQLTTQANAQLVDPFQMWPEETDLFDQSLFARDTLISPVMLLGTADHPEHSSPVSQAGQGSMPSARSDPEESPGSPLRTAAKVRESSSTSVSGTSLENISGAFSFYVGPTGTSDVYLLYRQAFLEDSTSSVASGLRFRLTEKPGQAEIGRGEELRGPQYEPDFIPPTLFGITDHALIDNAEPRAGPDIVEKTWSDLWSILDRNAAWRLIRLYLRFVEPQFPILSEDQIPPSSDRLESLSLALLAGICATALPFLVYDEALYTLLPRPPSGKRLYQICWLALWQEFHAPTLATLQACLILQHRSPSNPVLSDTAFKWTLMSSATAVAQTVGLHRDPSRWELVPLTERRLRRRLWWALWCMERWYALARGMPSHLHEDDFDVTALVMEDLENCPGSSSESKSHFLNLVGLTKILADIQKTFYTVRGSRETSNDLHASLDAARDIRTRLQEWNDALPVALRSRTQQGDIDTRSASMSKRLDANASLHLSYVVTHMTLFRALLRPLDFRTRIADCTMERGGPVREITSAVIKGALLCVKELVEFMEGLTAVQWNAFWHSWSRPNFAIAGSFMVHLLQVMSLPGESFSAGVNHAGSAPNTEGPPHFNPGRAVAGQQNDQATFSTRADPYFEVEFHELQSLIRRWRWANRMSVNNAAGAKGLTNLGLFKVETLLASLGSMTLSVDPDEGDP